MAAEKPEHLICLEAKPGNEAVQGSIIIKCLRCRTDIWISPTGLMMVGKGIKPVCMSCAEIINPPGEKMEIVPLTPEQQQELKDELQKRKLI